MGSKAEVPLPLFPNRRIHLRYAYQTNGGRSFSGGTVQSGIIRWRNGNGGVDFSEGVVEGFEPKDIRDLERHDFQSMQNCLTGAAGAVTATDCIIHLFDGDSDADALDAGAFVDCLYGPYSDPPAKCRP
ncbi:MAG: hypothetical protein AABZ47_00090 [Planctomycetota bacterium]